MELKNSQYQAIMREYEQKQLKSHNLLVSRYQEVYDKAPKFQLLDESIATLSVQYGKRLLGGDNNALESLKEELVLLRKNKHELLLAAGFPEDYLEPVYECDDCQDTGFIGKEKCHCFKRAIVDLLYNQSNLKDILQIENFDTFSFEFYSDSFRDEKSGRSSLAIIRDAFQICRDFARRFSEEKKNLFLYGDVGIGKTFLSNCIAREVIEAGFSVLYFSAPQFFNALVQGHFNRDDINALNLYEYIFDCDLLIIDDLGTEFMNTVTSSLFFSCINDRLRMEKSTVISTNLSLDSVADLYTERCFSRITSNYILLKLVGDDIRLKKKLMKKLSI